MTLDSWPLSPSGRRYLPSRKSHQATECIQWAGRAIQQLGQQSRLAFALSALPAITTMASLAAALRQFGPAYLATHALSTQQAKAWRAVVACRTAALGGQRSIATSAATATGNTTRAATGTARNAGRGPRMPGCKGACPCCKVGRLRLAAALAGVKQLPVPGAMVLPQQRGPP